MTNSKKSVMTKPVPITLLRNPIHCLSLGLGSGLAPKAPGTAGTVIGVLLYFPMQSLNWYWYLAIIVIGFLLGIGLCKQTADALQVHDHPAIVWDEIIGIWLTLFLVPAGWEWILLGFILFRLFDICKPWPIHLADRQVQGGFGIMLDDMIAALYSFGTIQIIAYLLYS